VNASERTVARRATQMLAAAVLLACLACAGSRPPLPYPPGPEGQPRRGGHAIFLREEDPDFLDPALSYGTYSAPLIECVYRTLLEYTDAPGTAGAVLAPELAESMPEVREGGRLIAFKVRREARFGKPLHRHITAADFKYAIERLFRVNSPGVSFYHHIEGADRVIAGQDTALAGVIARGDSLYFRLTRPDPIFLSILSLSFAAPLPREIAEPYAASFSQHTVSSGPFEIAEYTPRRRVLLVRNPDYHGTPAWLDTFELKLSVTPINAVALIRRGLADGGFFEVPGSELGRLRRDSTWSRQVDLADGLSTWFLFMNTRVRPFNDPRVRQAVAWAIDRRALAKAWSGKATPAGEFLPPGMPGARILGRYQGPDTARARRLLRAAGYPNGFETTLFGYTADPIPREAAIVQQNLADVGIRVRLDLSEAAGYTSFAGDTSNRVPFGFYGWFADYVDPSNFFDTLLNGRRITAIHNINLSLFDDPEVNARIDRAMTTDDPERRTRMWQEIDSLVMERAPVATTVHSLESRLYAPRIGGWYRHVTRILKIESLYLKEPGARALAGAGTPLASRSAGAARARTAQHAPIAAGPALESSGPGTASPPARPRRPTPASARRRSS
jgi:peptide/nickel transport system substrate-binding protein/oligopeptide transport system substrate-binding protein